jgi:photosystem II stability/assembly factor-like uncharacterized protein
MMRRFVVAVLLALVGVSHGEAGWNQWTSMGPGGEPVPVAIDPVTPATIYTATPNAEVPGVFKSTDGGAHWNPSSAGLTPSFVSALAVDPQTPTIVYVGAITPFRGARIGNDALFKSTDGGAHWSPSNAGFPPPSCDDTTCTALTVSVLVVDPQTPATVYAGTNVGVFKSTDGGSFWIASNTGLTDLVVGVLAVDPQTPATLYAATLTGVFKSTDGGAHWTASDTGLPHASICCPLVALPSVFSLTVDPRTPATVYAGTVNGVFKSTDGGARWAFSMTGVEFAGDHVSAVAIDPQAPATLYAATFGAGVLRSTDGGQRWAPFNAGLTDLFLTGLQMSPSGACLHAAGQFGVFSFMTGPDPCASSVNPFISVNEASFTVGQTLTTAVGLMNLGAPGPVDIYLGILLPGGSTVVFFTGAESVAFGSFDDLASFRPIAMGVPLVEAFAVTVPSFFSYRWTGAEPRGNYAFLFYAVRAGALADGTLTGDEILAFALTPFSFPEDAGSPGFH